MHCSHFSPSPGWDLSISFQDLLSRIIGINSRHLPGKNVWVLRFLQALNCPPYTAAMGNSLLAELRASKVCPRAQIGEQELQASKGSSGGNEMGLQASIASNLQYSPQKALNNTAAQPLPQQQQFGKANKVLQFSCVTACIWGRLRRRGYQSFNSVRQPSAKFLKFISPPPACIHEVTRVVCSNSWNRQLNCLPQTSPTNLARDLSRASALHEDCGLGCSSQIFVEAILQGTFLYAHKGFQCSTICGKSHMRPFTYSIRPPSSRASPPEVLHKVMFCFQVISVGETTHANRPATNDPNASTDLDALLREGRELSAGQEAALLAHCNPGAEAELAASPPQRQDSGGEHTGWTRSHRSWGDRL